MVEVEEAEMMEDIIMEEAAWNEGGTQVFFRLFYGEIGLTVMTVITCLCLILV